MTLDISITISIIVTLISITISSSLKVLIICNCTETSEEMKQLDSSALQRAAQLEARTRAAAGHLKDLGFKVYIEFRI